MPTEHHAVKLVKRIDLIFKLLLGIGFLLVAYLFFRHPGLIGVFVLLGIILLAGFYLPRHIGWKIRENRALEAKTQELSKWEFASRDREGPWINYIDYPVVLKTPVVAGQQFFSNWLVIDQGFIIVNPGPSVIDKKTKTVSYNLQSPTTYAWDGCTPKRLFYWFALVGTPDWWHREHAIDILNKNGFVVQKTVFWQLAQHASLIHDALYQYLDIIPLSKEEVDDLFYQMLMQAELPEFLAKLYLFAVTKFGANDLPTTRPTYPELKCESFKHLAEDHKFS